jgi:hypothetical protein
MGFSSDWKSDDGLGWAVGGDLLTGRPLGREIRQRIFARKGPRKII